MEWFQWIKVIRTVVFCSSYLYDWRGGQRELKTRGCRRNLGLAVCPLITFTGTVAALACSAIHSGLLPFVLFGCASFAVSCPSETSSANHSLKTRGLCGRNAGSTRSLSAVFCSQPVCLCCVPDIQTKNSNRPLFSGIARTTKVRQ